MLVSEERMTEGEGLVLASPSQGLGYQLGGALRRLGRRTITLVSGPEERRDLERLPTQEILFDWKNADTRTSFPVKAGTFSALFATPWPALGLGLPLEAPEWKALLNLFTLARATSPQAHLVAVLASTEGPERIDQILTLHSRTTVFITPPVYGFRDGGIVSESLRLLENDPATLLREIPAVSSTAAMAYAGDVAALLISTPGQEKLFGKVLYVEPSVTSLESWRESFVRHFEVQAGALSRLGARLSSRRPFADLDSIRFAASPRALSGRPREAAGNFFPSNSTGIERAMRSLADNHRRDPALGLVFPPGRSL